MVYAVDEERRQRKCKEVSGIVDGVNRLDGEPRIEVLQPQDCQWLTVDGQRCRKEHFGFDDGISNPDVEGVPDRDTRGGGNPDDEGGFRKIPAGEFILGYPGEGGEVAPMPLPHILGRNGAYLVMRKLQQHVGRFRKFTERVVTASRHVPAGLDPADHAEYLAAKMVGRWKDGSPLVLFPEGSAARTTGRPDRTNTFGYASDLAGACCPLGAHIRRANPRDSLGFGGKLVRRRRLIRRGIAYGDYLPDGADDETDDQAHPGPSARGIMFLAFNSGLDQFEFVQQAWIGMGDDFQQGNDMDPVVGSRGERQMMIPGDEATGRLPFLCSGIPRFVTTRGGEYFFAPSLTGLRLLATGQVVVS